MIENLSLSCKVFDLRGFVDSFLAITRTWSEGDNAMASVSTIDSFDGIPIQDRDERRDLFCEMVEDELLLFFPMHECVCEEEVRCIDGSIQNAGDFDIGMSDAYGLLVEVRDGWVNLYPSLYDGSSNVFPAIHLQSTCSCVEEAMTSFVQQFARPSDKPVN